MNWSAGAVIGFNAAGDYYQNHPLSETLSASEIGCLALPQTVNNVVYDLVPAPEQVDCAATPPAPPRSLGEKSVNKIEIKRCLTVCYMSA